LIVNALVLFIKRLRLVDWLVAEADAV